MVRLSIDPEAHVVQYCSSKGKACGIATYADMLAKAHRQRVVGSLQELSDLGDIPLTHLHVQHEFGMMPIAELKQIFAYCSVKNIRCYVTMHTVVPLPTFLQYVHHRLVRPFCRHDARNALLGIPWGIARLLFQIWEDLLWIAHRALRGNLRLWKRWHRIKAMVHVPRSGKRPPGACASTAHRPWVWQFSNPDYDMESYFNFRAAQRMIMNHAAKIIVHCQEAERALFAMGARRVETVPHGVLLAPVSPLLHSARDGKIHVGCFGFLHPHKCLLQIIDACAKIPDVRLHIYASAEHCGMEDTYRKQVQERAEKHAWIDLCTCHLPLPDVIFSLSQCDLNVWFASPPGGISVSGSICQYLAAGRPIVASDSVMISALRACMRVVPPGNTDALAVAIMEHRGSDTGKIVRRAKALSWENVSARYDQRDRLPQNISYPQRMFKSQKEWMDLRYTFKKHILLMMNKDPFDTSINFDAVLQEHPEFIENPLAAYEHLYVNGNPDAAPPAKKIIFIHLQRTAGSTLTEIIARNVRSIAFRRGFAGKRDVGEVFVLSRFRSLPRHMQEQERDKWDRYDVFANHCMYGTHELIRSPYAYITMLRRPLDRLLSYYLFMKRNAAYTNEGDWSGASIAAGLSLKEFIEHPYFREQLILNHLSVQVLCGTRDRTVTEEHLRRAMEHLSTFEAVMITERFDESVRLLSALYGWKDELRREDGTIVAREGLRVGTVTEGSNAAEALTEEEREAASAFLALDTELYRFACTMFEEQLREHRLLPEPHAESRVSPERRERRENLVPLLTSL